MSNYAEPVILAECDRSFGDKHEKLRLEQDEYKGAPTFTLRVVWQGQDGNWRWSQQRPSEKTGKCFQALHLKPAELQKLGEALISAARGASTQRLPTPGPNARTANASAGFRDDDIPF